MAEVFSTFQLKPGDIAPDFSLPDFSGKTVTRDQVSGPGGMLVVFACNHCPYVIHVADALGELARGFADAGVGTVAINSNDVENYPRDAPGLMREFAAAHHWDFPYLVDESQAVARAYGAACTPDFFLFDGSGRLFYAGQFDDTRPRSGAPAHGGDLSGAVRRMAGGGTPVAHARPSSGCNIKWKDGNRPDWWNAGT